MILKGGTIRLAAIPAARDTLKTACRGVVSCAQTGFTHQHKWYMHWPKWRNYKWKIEYHRSGYKIRNTELMTRLSRPMTRETPDEVMKRKNDLFDEEKKRQASLIARVDKIEVDVVGGVKEELLGSQLFMNKDVSTPYDVSKHFDEFTGMRAIVAELEMTVVGPDGKKETVTTLWDMHRPLPEHCRLKFRHIKEEDCWEINKIYWRSCSFMLGMAATRAFKEAIPVHLHSWPKPDPRKGSFVYDVYIGLQNVWRPSEPELRAITSILWQIRQKQLFFERLTVHKDLAKEIFKENPFKPQQIESIAESSQDGQSVTLYRLEDHIDVSVGPMISRSDQVGRINIAAIHPLSSPTHGIFYRFQGVSLPQLLPLNPFVYQNILTPRAKALNPSPMPEGAQPLQEQDSIDGSMPPPTRGRSRNVQPTA